MAALWGVKHEKWQKQLNAKKTGCFNKNESNKIHWWIITDHNRTFRYCPSKWPANRKSNVSSVKINSLCVWINIGKLIWINCASYWCLHEFTWPNLVKSHNVIQAISLINLLSSCARCVGRCLECIHRPQSLVSSTHMAATHAWNYTVQRALIVVTHLENQILAKTDIPV